MHTFTLNENDFINFHLYEASTNPSKIKSRKKSFFILLVLSLLTVFCGYLKDEIPLMYYGLFCAFLVLCFGNIYLRWRHKRHYTRHVKNNFNCQSEESVQIEIIDDHIRMIDSASDSNVKISEIKVVNEIKNYYFLKLSTGLNLVIPKTLSSLNDEVNAMIRNHNIPHFVQLDWKWR